MRPDERIVVTIPLTELWDERGTVIAERRRDVGAAEIAALLREGPVHFVLADVGYAPVWTRVDACFEYWKKHVKSHLVVDPSADFHPENYPKGYCYLASQWWSPGQRPIILLEMYH